MISAGVLPPDLAGRLLGRFVDKTERPFFQRVLAAIFAILRRRFGEVCSTQTHCNAFAFATVMKGRVRLDVLPASTG